MVVHQFVCTLTFQTDALPDYAVIVCVPVFLHTNQFNTPGKTFFKRTTLQINLFNYKVAINSLAIFT